MDQTTPAHQTLLRHQRQRGEDANPDFGLRLRVGGDYEKQVHSGQSLYSILQILSINAFSQDPLQQLLSKSESPFRESDCCNQLVFSY
jgi:hypothetical protein